jgi:hypothetical protein
MRGEDLPSEESQKNPINIFINQENWSLWTTSACTPQGIRSTRRFLKSFLFFRTFPIKIVGGTRFLFIPFPCVASCYENLGLSSDVARGKGIRPNEVQIKIKTGYDQYYCIARGTGWMKKCSSGCQSYITSLLTASSGLHGPTARNRGISQLHAHTIVIYTANVFAIFIRIQGRILKLLFLETA